MPQNGSSDIFDNLLLEHEPEAYRYAVQFMGIAMNRSDEAALEEKRRQVLGEETDED
jgi:hypothetical protein